jgi:hypothetical protein
MNGIITAIRFVTYTVGGLAIRKAWNWLIEDVDPIPGTKEFDEEYAQTKAKYIRLTKKKEKYEAYRKSRRTIS